MSQVLEQGSRAKLWTALGAMVVMLSVAGGAELLRPTIRLADIKPPVVLDSQVPEQFGEWTLDRSMVPVLPSPDVEASLNKLYSATLARTYVNGRGERVLLSIAYGSDQGSEATAVHRPEFCYSAQGFQVNGQGVASLDLGSESIQVQRLIGTQGRRYEPITYWITLDERATLPGFGRKLEQLKFGIRGEIPDGLLFRMSTIGLPDAEAFALQERFAQALFAVMEPTIRPRYFGY